MPTGPLVELPARHSATRGVRAHGTELVGVKNHASQVGARGVGHQTQRHPALARLPPVPAPQVNQHQPAAGPRHMSRVHTLLGHPTRRGGRRRTPFTGDRKSPDGQSRCQRDSSSARCSRSGLYCLKELLVEVTFTGRPTGGSSPPLTGVPTSTRGPPQQPARRAQNGRSTLVRDVLRPSTLAVGSLGRLGGTVATTS